MTIRTVLGVMTTELSFNEMWKASRPIPLINTRFMQDPNEEEANAVGAVGGSPGGGGGGGGGGSLGPVGGISPGGGGGMPSGSSLGPVGGIQPGGGGGMPSGGGQFVPTTPMPTSAEVNRGNFGNFGGGDGFIWNNWGPGGWGWPFGGYGYGYPYGYGYGYPYGGYPYPYPQQQQNMVCRQSEDDPKEFVCYPQYRQAVAYTWGPPYWGW